MTTKLLLGGSPCTHWSIAQTKNRETKPEGLGWELFRNYLIAREKYKPDYFLYENNKSMSAAIREQITRELGVEPILINSALVSAQNRQRLYWTNIPGVEQPEDCRILLRDILESGVCWREKAYTLDAHYYKTPGTYDPKRQRAYSCIMAAEPVSCTKSGKSYTLKANYANTSAVNGVGTGHFPAPMAAEPVRIGTIKSGTKTNHDSRPFRVYSPDGKGVTLQGEAGGYGAKTGLYAAPMRGNRVGGLYGQHTRWGIFDPDGKTPCLTASAGMGGGHLPMIPIGVDGPITKLHVLLDGKSYPIYEVRDGQMTIKDKQYPIKLADGFYIIRKLTVTECKRLQTVPEDYIFPVSDTQAYKMLGNGWTVDVIAHILSFCPGIATEPVEVLSMYDGMSCGRLALNKLGANVVRYYATEIDKYAINAVQANFPDTVQLGDAFGVRDDGWAVTGHEFSGGH